MEDDHLDYMAIHYLYTRSFYRDQQNDWADSEAVNYYLGQAEKYWMNKNNYSQYWSYFHLG